MKVVVITQARLGSTRFPNKILKKIKGETLLGIHVNRIKKCKAVSAICIATTNKVQDSVISDLAKAFDVHCFKGSEDDVLDRYYCAAQKMNADLIVRLTADCPLIDPVLIDEIVKKAKQELVDYYTNTLIENFPDGQDVEVFTFAALKEAWINAKLLSDREHVTSYIRNNSSFNGGSIFTSDNYYCDKNYNSVRLTVDEEVDFKVIEHIINDIGVNENWKTYAEYYLSKKKISLLNNNITRNEGYQKSIEANKKRKKY